MSKKNHIKFSKCILKKKIFLRLELPTKIEIHLSPERKSNILSNFKNIKMLLLEIKLMINVTFHNIICHRVH